MGRIRERRTTRVASERTIGRRKDSGRPLDEAEFHSRLPPSPPPPPPPSPLPSPPPPEEEEGS